MPSREPFVVRSVASDDDLAPAPIDPSWIIEGTPQARSRRLALPDDGTVGVTLWECTAGRFDWHYNADEFVEILAGEVEVTPPGGSPTMLRKGDVVWFPGGQIVRWHVPEYVKKMQLNSTKMSTVRELAHRVPFARRLVHGLRSARVRA